MRKIIGITFWIIGIGNLAMVATFWIVGMTRAGW